MWQDTNKARAVLFSWQLTFDLSIMGALPIATLPPAKLLMSSVHTNLLNHDKTECHQAEPRGYNPNNISVS